MPDERPSSFGQALESAGYDATASSASEPVEATPAVEAQSEDGSSPSTPVASSDDAAPTEAAPREPSPTPEPLSGSIPTPDHQRIVKGFHEKLDAAERQLKDLSWAQQLPPEVGPEFVAMAQRANGDPVAFLREFTAQIQNDPRHQPALRSYYASMLGSRPAAAPVAAQDAPPEPDIVVDGHAWYSAAQQAKRDEWLTRQLAAQLGPALDERVAPLADLAKQVADARARQEEDVKAKDWAAQEFERISKRPGFVEHQKAISDRFDAEVQLIPKAEQTSERLAILLRDIYADVVIPQISTTSNQALLKTLTAKAVNGSLGASPTVAATATRPRSMGEAFRQAGL